mmetsp:Transcript_9722/g.14394  ORF Transcript_9722/g.14394 Transcript_9722/m.14394 type:complete len:280 (+) Transcript_9722:114-953(+)
MNASRTTTTTTEPNIIDFMRAIGEKQTSNNTRRNMKLYTDRKVLRLSAQWASAVTKQRNKILYINNPYRSDHKIDKALSALSPECAALEIRAIDLLSSIEAKSTHMASLTKADDDKYGTLYYGEEEDDYLSAELASLDESTRLLQLELESVQIQSSPYNNHHHHHHSDEYDANASRAELTYYEVPEQHVAQHEFLEPQPIIRRRMPKSFINWSPRSSYDETSFHKVVVGKRGPASYERCVTLPDFSSNVGRNNIMPIPLDLPVLSHLTFTSEIRSGFLN